MNRNRTVLAIATLAVAFSAGCATKNHVRSQVTPVINKVNELDDLTAKNTRDIRDVDTRTQSGLNDVNAKSAAAAKDGPATSRAASTAELRLSRRFGGGVIVER